MDLRVTYLSRPAIGETENGDRVVQKVAGKRTLLAVFDAVGHGPKAAAASDLAERYVEAASLDAGIGELTRGLHLALRGTRGAAAALCLLDGGHLEGCCIGNVELRCLGSSVPVMMTPGVLGHRIRSLRVFEAELVAGDRLVVNTDGVPLTGTTDLERLDAAGACEHLMRRWERREDDATVLVADLTE